MQSKADEGFELPCWLATWYRSDPKHRQAASQWCNIETIPVLLHKHKCVCVYVCGGQRKGGCVCVHCFHIVSPREREIISSFRNWEGLIKVVKLTKKCRKWKRKERERETESRDGQLWKTERIRSVDSKWFVLNLGCLVGVAVQVYVCVFLRIRN